MRYPISLSLLAAAAFLSLSTPAEAGALSQSYLSLQYSRSTLDIAQGQTSLESDNPGAEFRLASGPDGFLFGEYQKTDSETTDREASSGSLNHYQSKLTRSVLGFGQRWPAGNSGEFFAKIGYIRNDYTLGGDYAYQSSTASGSTVSGNFCDTNAIGTASQFCGSGQDTGLMWSFGGRFQLSSWLEMSAEYARYGGVYDKLAKSGVTIDNTALKGGLDFLITDAAAIGLHYRKQGDLTETTRGLRLDF